MEIDGWSVRIDDEGNYLRTSRERPKTHYVITLLKRFAIDIELRKEEVDAIPEDKKDETLRDAMKKAIDQAGNKMPWETTFEWK